MKSWVSLQFSRMIEPRSLICACLAALMGVSVTLGVEQWWTGGSPIQIIIKDIKVVPVPGTHNALWLEVNASAPTSPGCMRQSEHLIYRTIMSENGPIRQYFPLGGALAGAGFSSSEYEFQTALRLPYRLPPGQWFYINRSAYSCIIWPGLIRLIKEESPPTEFTVIPPSEVGNQ